MKKLFFLLIIVSFFYTESIGQGCVAIRSTGGFCTASMNHPKVSPWVVGINNRYFKSYKHFVGTEEQKERVEKGTEVINHSYTLDILVTRNINARWSFTFDLPVISNARSSLYEHDGKSRYSTHSFGLGDVRVTGYGWIIDPSKMPKGNLQVGLGLKFPTGDYRYQDFFVKSDSIKVLGPVDQSIQLGDGGTGFTTELNGFYNFTRELSVYGNFFYLFNPREQNGVPVTLGGRIPQHLDSIAGNIVTSVTDVYSIRAGASFSFNKLSFSLGIREEGVPVYDLVGGSQGVRRPGYNLSVEPGIVYNLKKISFYGYVPVIVSRGTKQNVPDKFKSGYTGTYTISQGGFANYLVFIGISFRL